MLKMIKEFRIQLKTNAIFRRSLVAILLAEIIIVVLITTPLIKSKNGLTTLLQFDSHVGIALFTGIPLFLITVIQLQHNSSLQRSNFIREFATRLHNDRELSETFYYLVYTYSNDTYDKFIKANASEKEEMQGNRKEGMRLYDPMTFQYTEEERRLDSLLGFFNVLGYHHHKGVVHIQDIAGVMGFHLAALSTRKSIINYRKEIPSQWKGSSFTEEFESVSPYRYLGLLLKAFKDFSKENQKEIDELNALNL